MKAKCYYFMLFLWFQLPAGVQAAWLENVPQTVTLPDHSVIHCFSTGDEFFNWLHDADGYTLIFGDDGFLYYAVQDGPGLKPSSFRVNSVTPKVVGIEPWTLISQEAYQQKRQSYLNTGKSSTPPSGPHFGVINNLVVFIRFSDQSEFTDSCSFFQQIFNSGTPGANSMRNYFREASYLQLSIESYFLPSTAGPTVISYQDGHERNYYQPYNATSNPSGYQNDSISRVREHTLLRDAVNAISSQVGSGLNIDQNNDGNVDNVCFILNGQAGPWNSILWPHKWNLTTHLVYINGKRVWDYNVQVQGRLPFFGNSDLSHEMFHTIGAPDLYHYNTGTNLNPVGRWDIMEDSQNPPEHMCAYMKATYGLWLASTPIISESGYYTLYPLNTFPPSQVCYRINSPSTAYEFFVVEYRKQNSTFENSVPGNGMIIYRINSNFAGNANYNGTDVFDEVYAYRPNGSTTQNGYINLANYTQLQNQDRTVLNCHSTPTPYLTQGGPGGLDIREITDNDGTLTFLLVNCTDINLTLDQPNTSGVKVATNDIWLRDGFDTGPANTFRAMITDCPTSVSAVFPHFEFLTVEVSDMSNQKIGSFTVQSVVGSAFSINSIKDKPDDRGNYLDPGEYLYTVKKAGAEIEKGTLMIDRR
jgi:M6 family metalloprotease-like protein